MARKTTSLSEAFTILEILRRIPRNRHATITEIQVGLAAAGIEVETRTLQRYMKAICENESLGIECDMRSRPYGFRQSPKGSDFLSTQMSAHESLLMRLAEEHMRYLMPSVLTKSLSPFFEAAQENMSETGKSRRESDWLKKVAVVSSTLPVMPPNIKQKIFDSVSEALFREVKLDLQYKNSAGKTVNAVVSPLGLVQQDVRLYLVCRFEGYDNVRHLALHRISRSDVTEFSVERPKGFSLDAYIAERHFNYTDGENQKIRLSFDFTNPVTAQNLRETPFNRSQKIIEVEKGLWRLTVEIEDSPLLAGWFAVWQERAGIKNVQRVPIGVSPVIEADEPEPIASILKAPLQPSEKDLRKIAAADKKVPEKPSLEAEAKPGKASAKARTKTPAKASKKPAAKAGTKVNTKAPAEARAKANAKANDKAPAKGAGKRAKK